MKPYLREKIEFVEKLSPILITHLPHITEVKYEVYQHKTQAMIQEFLVINFEGGGQVVRNSNGNSCGAILREIGKYIDGGYYAELEFYADFKDGEAWERLI